MKTFTEEGIVDEIRTHLLNAPLEQPGCWDVLSGGSDPSVMVRIIATRDVGHRPRSRNGYECSLHVSMSARRGELMMVPPRTDLDHWARLIFGEHVEKVAYVGPADRGDTHRHPQAGAFTAHLRLYLARGHHVVTPTGVHVVRPWAA